MRTLELNQMESFYGGQERETFSDEPQGLSWGCRGNAVLVGASLGTGNFIAAIELTMIAYDMGCLDEW